MKTFTRTAEAGWKGSLDKGEGLITTESGALTKQPYSFAKRVEQSGGTETNPEELIAAAVASCFGMALSKTLQDDDVIPQQLVVTASVTAELGEGIKVTTLRLDVAGMVGGYSAEQFEKAVEKTRGTCPIHQLLEPGFESIEVTATLRN